MRFDLHSFALKFGTLVTSLAVSFPSLAVAQEPVAPGAAATPPQAGENKGISPDAAAGESTEAGQQDAKALLDKADAALKAGDFQAAVAGFSELVNGLNQSGASASPEGLNALFLAYTGRGTALIGLKDYAAAIADFKQVIDINQGYAPALVGRGKAYLETQQVEQAFADLQNAVKIDPKNAEAQLGLGKALVAMNRADEAIAPLTKAVEANPKDAEALRVRGTAYAGAFKNKQAIDDLQQAISVNPDDQETYYTLGMVYLRSEDYQKAVEQIEKAIEHFKPKEGHEDEPFLQGFLTASSAYIEIGKATKDEAIRKKAYTSALELADKALAKLDEKNPAHAQALGAVYYSRGVAERMLKEYGAAVRSLSRAIELNPEMGEAYYRRGICFHMLNEDKMAIADFQQAAHLSYDDPRCNLWEGFTYSKLGDYNQAVRAYGDAIAASDRYTPAYANRALAYMMLGEFDKAVSDFNQAIRLAPTNADYYYKRGLAYEYQKDYKRAADSFANAIEFDGKNAEAYRHMAAVQKALGHNDLAAEYAQKANDLMLQEKKSPATPPASAN